MQEPVMSDNALSAPNHTTARRMPLGWLLLFLILLLGAFLRFYQLGFQSFWNDELSSVLIARQSSPAEVIRFIDLHDNPPPAYFLILYTIRQYLGANEASFRLPTAISGLLAILAIFALANAAYGKETAFLAAALLAVSWGNIYYSQEARPNGMMPLLTALSSLGWILILRRLADSHGRSLQPGAAALYVASSVLAAYTHIFSITLIVFQALWAFVIFLRQRQAIARLILVYGAILLLYLPWLPFLWRDLGLSQRWYGWNHPPGWYDLAQLGELFYGASTLAIAVGLLLTAWALWSDLRALARQDLPITRRLVHPTLLLSVGLFTPPFLAILQSYLTPAVPLFAVRNLILCAPLALVLCARGVYCLPMPGPGRTFVAAALIILSLVNLTLIQKYYSTPTKEQFRQAAWSATRTQAQYPQTAVVAYAWNRMFFDHYFINAGSPLPRRSAGRPD